MDEPIKKKVDESWKEQAEREKEAADVKASQGAEVLGGQGEGGGPKELPEARLDLFISGLAVEVLIALGEVPHPTTRKRSMSLPQAKYLIDLLGVIHEKTKGNLSADEEKLMNDTVYQLRMRYLSKSESPPK